MATIDELIANTKARRLQNQVGGQKKKIAALGGKAKTGGPSILSRVFDVISRPLYTIAEPVARAAEGQSYGNIAKGAVGGFTGKNKADFGTVIERGAKNSAALRGINENRLLKSTIGFGLDVALDPTTYIGAGIVKAGGKAAAQKAGIKAVTEHLAKEEVSERILKSGATAIKEESEKRAVSGAKALSEKGKQKVAKSAMHKTTLEEGRPIFKEVSEALKTAEPGKVQLRFMGKKIGESEKLYAGAAKAGEKIGSTPIGGALNRAFRTSSILPEETKRISRQIAQAGVKGYEKRATEMRNFFKDLDPEERRMVSHAIEEGDVSLTPEDLALLQTGTPKSVDPKKARTGAVPKADVDRVRTEKARLGTLIEDADEKVSDEAYYQLQRLQKDTPPSVWAEAQRIDKESYAKGRIPTAEESAKYTPEELEPFPDVPRAAPTGAAPVENIVGRTIGEVAAEREAVKAAGETGIKINKVEVGKKRYNWTVTDAEGNTLGTFKSRGEANKAAIEKARVVETPQAPQVQSPVEPPTESETLSELVTGSRADVTKMPKVGEEVAPTPKPDLTPEQEAYKLAKEQEAAFERGELDYSKGKLTNKETGEDLGGIHPRVARERAEASLADSPERTAKWKELEESDNEFYKHESTRRHLVSKDKRHDKALELDKKRKAEVKTTQSSDPVIQKVTPKSIIQENITASKIRPGDRIKVKGAWHLVKDTGPWAGKIRVTFPDDSKVLLDPDLSVAGSVSRQGAEVVVENVPYYTTLDMRHTYARQIKSGDRIYGNDGWKLVDEVVTNDVGTTFKFVDGTELGPVNPEMTGLGVSRPLSKPRGRVELSMNDPGKGGGASWWVDYIEDGDKFVVHGPHLSDGPWPISRDPLERALALEEAHKLTGVEAYRIAAKEAEGEAIKVAKVEGPKIKKELKEVEKKQKEAVTRKEKLQKELDTELAAKLKEADEAIAKPKAEPKAEPKAAEGSQPLHTVKAGDRVWDGEGWRTVEDVQISFTAKGADDVTVKFEDGGTWRKHDANNPVKVEKAAAPKVAPPATAPVAAPASELDEFLTQGASKVQAGAAPPAPPKPPTGAPGLGQIAEALKKVDATRVRPPEDAVTPSMAKAATHPERVYRSTLHGTTSKGGKDLGTYVDEARRLFRLMGDLEVEAGLFKPLVDKKGNVIKSADDWLKDNYVYHFYKGGTDQERQAFKSTRKKVLGSDVATFTKQRTVATLKAAKEKGLKPVEEIDDILAMRMGKHFQAMARKQFVTETTAMYGSKLAGGAARVIAKEQGLREVKGVPGLKGVYFPDKIARSLEAVEHLHNSPQASRELMQIFDKVQSHWKFAATGLNPGHHIRNMLGDFWNNYLDGVTDPRRYGMSAKLLFSKVPNDKIRVSVGGITVSGEDVLNHNIRSGAAPGFFSSEYGADFNKLRPSSAKRKLIEMGEKREEYMRLAHFIDALKDEGKHITKAMSPEKQAAEVTEAANRAAMRVRKWNIDYGDMTEFESKVMKRAVPFYTWSRKNIPLQFEALAMRPGKVASIPKGQAAISRLLGAEVGYNEESPEILPKWIKEMAPIRLSGENAEGHSMFGVPALPFHDVSRFAEGGRQGILRSLISQLTPGARIPLEQATGNQIFSGAPVKGDVEYFSGQVPLLRMGHAAATGKLKKDKLINYLTGAGIYDIGPQQAASELRRQQDPLQAQIRALREGYRRKAMGG